MRRPVVGVVGGGQLARMMIPAALALGVELRVFAESSGSPAAAAATKVGDYTDFNELAGFCKGLDVLTFDHEHVPLALLCRLEAQGVRVSPGPHALAHTQNKLVMRRRLAELGAPVPIWAEASSSDDIANFIESYGPEIVVKTPIGGYDGKGVRVISSPTQVTDWLDNIDGFGGKLLLEQKVPFQRELAVLSARNQSGAFRSWPVAQTTQHQGVCAEVIAPAPGETPVAQAEQIARLVAEGLQVEGVLAVELFQLADGSLLVNELAMRPHNSGHFTIEGSVTSQFEQHLRAVLNLGLGDTRLLQPWAVMVNLLGVDDKNTLVENHPIAMAQYAGVKLHNYQKVARAGRKMGHVTVTGKNLDELLADARHAVALIRGE